MQTGFGYGFNSAALEVEGNPLCKTGDTDLGKRVSPGNPYRISEAQRVSPDSGHDDLPTELGFFDHTPPLSPKPEEGPTDSGLVSRPSLGSEGASWVSGRAAYRLAIPSSRSQYCPALVNSSAKLHERPQGGTQQTQCMESIWNCK